MLRLGTHVDTILGSQGAKMFTCLMDPYNCMIIEQWFKMVEPHYIIWEVTYIGHELLCIVWYYGGQGFKYIDHSRSLLKNYYNYHGNCL
jgi:hypothetical protein